MRYSLASLALLPLALAASSPTTAPPASVTGELDYTELDLDQTQYISYLISDGFKPAAASYRATVANSNTAVQSAIEAFEDQTISYVLTGSLASVLATATGSANVVAGLQLEEAQITGAPSQYRDVLSSVWNHEIALQTAAAAPRDLALSAGVAGVVAAAAGVAVAL